MRIQPMNIIANARVFGTKTSIPQGYNNPARALVATLQTGGNIAARSKTEAFLTADVRGQGNMAATMAAETDFIANANVLSNGYATFATVTDMFANLGGQGNISAKMDILARPSAFDIAQEVWNSQTTAYAGVGTLGKAVDSAEKAAKLAAALSA